MKKKRAHACRRAGLAAHMLLYLLAAAFVFPVLLTCSNSFMSTGEILQHYGAVFPGSGQEGLTDPVLQAVPDMVSLSQYKTILLLTPDYLYQFLNSLILVVPVTVFQLWVALLAAYGFTRYRGRVREILFFSYLVLMLLPSQVTLVPNYIAADYFHLLDTRWAIWLPGIFSPFAVYLLTCYMRRLPEALWDAARTDGAGEWQIFTRLCVPLCKGIVTAAAILIFVDYWNMVEQPVLLISDEKLYPLSVFLSRINAEDTGIAFAAAVLYMIPCLLLYFYGQDDLKKGIAVYGGIKE